MFSNIFSRTVVVLCLLVFSPLSKAQFRLIQPGNDANNALLNIDLYNGKEGFAAFDKWVGVTSDSGKTFVQKPVTLFNVNSNTYPANLTFGFVASGLKAIDKNTFLLYGQFGNEPSILYSTDQGNNYKIVYWSPLDASNIYDAVYDMALLSGSNTGFAVQERYILKTTDGGKTWIKNNPMPGAALRIIEQTDNATLYAAETTPAGRLYKSTDGAVTWNAITLPPSQGEERLVAMHFLTASKGWINMVGQRGGVIYYTADGGQHWAAKTDPGVASFNTTSMRFVDDNNGYLLSDKFNVLKTSDAGKTWEPLPKEHTYAGQGEQTTIFTFGSQLIWAAGENGFLQFSSNGGGEPLPEAYFLIDTSAILLTGRIKLQNYSKPGYQFLWQRNGATISGSYNAEYPYDPYRQSDTITLIAKNGNKIDTTIKIQFFDIRDIPVITGFSPAAGGEGSTITITGTNLHGVNAVRFGGVAARSLSIISPTMIEAVVGMGASGEISVASGYAASTLPGFSFIPALTAPAPVISTASAWSGKVGSTLNIDGVNFGANPSENKVFFGSIEATILSANTNRITCIVPVGAVYGRIIVLNTSSGQQTTSPLPFSIPFVDNEAEVEHNFAGHSFETKFEIPLTDYNHLRFIEVADFDGDGRTDLAAVRGTGTLLYDSIRVYRNNGVGQDFSMDLRAITVARGNDLAIADMNGDGKPDIVSISGAIRISLNTSTPGNISFAPPYFLTGIDTYTKPLLDDLDGDGRIDIVARESKTPFYVRIFRNNGSTQTLSFARLPLMVMQNNIDFVCGDIDQDGKKELYFYRSMETGWARTLLYLKNISTPGEIVFAAPEEFSVPGDAFQTNELHVIDYDNDSRPELAILNESFFHVYRNSGTNGVLELSSPFSMPTLGYNADFTGSMFANFIGSKYPDVVSGLRLRGRLAAYKNTSVPGILSSQAGIFVGDASSYFGAMADMNNDGRPDYISCPLGTGSLNLQILANRVGIPITQRVCPNGLWSITADITGNTYKWQIDRGTGFVDMMPEPPFVLIDPVYETLYFKQIPPAWNGYKFRCIIDDTLYSSVFKFEMETLPVTDVSISVPATDFCRNTPVTFTATPSYSAGVNFLWQVNGITKGQGTSMAFTTTLLKNNDKVRVIAVFPGGNCTPDIRDTSAVISMTEKGVGPMISIIAPTNIVCTDSLSVFTTVTEAAGTAPVYQWQVNGVNAGMNNPTFSAVLKTGDKVKVFLTSDVITCNDGTPVVSTEVPAAVTTSVVHNTVISFPVSSVCPNVPVVVMATSTPSTVNATYSWKVNGQTISQVTGSTLSLPSLTETSQIQAIATASRACAFPATIATNIITIEVKPALKPKITILGATTTTTGQPVLLTAIPQNGGANPLFDWQDSSGSAGWKPLNQVIPSINFTPSITGHKVRCILTSSDLCANPKKDTSAPVVISISSVTSTSPEPASNAGIRFYPSPVTNALTIDSLRLQDKWETIDVFTVAGKLEQTHLVKAQFRVTIPVYSLPSGSYVAVIRRKNGLSVYFKFIKL